MAALAWIPSRLSRSGLRWILLAVTALLVLAWERKRRLTRALTAQVSVVLSSPYARQAVLAAARHLRITVVDGAACQWADFAEMDWDAFLSQGPSLQRASSLYVRTSLVRKGMLAHYLAKRRCEGVLPASFVVDVEDEEDLQLLPERFRKWAAAQTTKCDGTLVVKAGNANRGEHLHLVSKSEEIASRIRDEVLQQDGVGVLTMNSPPVNSLGTSLVTSFKQEFPKLVQDPKVKAIVITGSGSMFSGGAEITEFAMMVAMGEAEMRKNNPVAALSEMMDTIDASPKTVVAALNGPALGGGCEVSLACHYRVAAPKASVGFPEVNLGLLPGAQGTQRLPRVAALPVALPMILQGRPMNAEAAKKNGIIDVVAKGDVVDEAAEFALTHPPAPISKREVPKTNRFMVAAGGLEQALNTAFNAQPLMVAPGGIIKCFEAACSGKIFREGVAVEMEEFTKLVFSVQSAALRHLFLAERMAQKVPGVNEKPAPLKQIGILGAGLMGGGIAMCFVQKGIPVVLKDAKQEWLDDGMKKIQGLWGGQAKRGRLSQEKYKQYMSLLKPTLDYADFKDVDMVIEAVPEIMDLKKQVFLDIEKNTKPDALICTNTSGLNIDDIAAVLKDPSRVMGTHFFSPANVMQLLENVRTSKSSTKTLATGMAMGKLISKKAIMVGNCDGFVGNRMLAPYAGEAKMVLEEGASIEQVDAAAQKFGMAMGPMALGDLVGLELFWKQRKAAGDMKKQTKTYYGPYELTDWLCEQGRFGLKTPDPKIKANGRGVFIHRGRSKEVDPEVVAKLDEVRKAKGMTPRAVSDEEICERLFFSMINEGFKILEEGFVARSSDIDLAYIYGYGFPPAKGGPMFYAENYAGFKKILERVKYYNEQAKERFTKNSNYLPIDYFEPSKLLEACAAKEGTKVFPGQTLIDVVLADFRKKSSAPGPFAKL